MIGLGVQLILPLDLEGLPFLKILPFNFSLNGRRVRSDSPVFVSFTLAQMLIGLLQFVFVDCIAFLGDWLGLSRGIYPHIQCVYVFF